MKKLLVTLIVSLVFSGSIFAQHPETHWPGFDYHAFEMQGALYASIMVDGVPVYNTTENWDQLEVAAFVGDELRMTAMFLTDEYVIDYGDPFPTLNAEPVYYTTPGEVVTFKMYNHATGVEYGSCQALIWEGEDVTILTGEEHWEGLEDPEHPLMLNFSEGDAPIPTFTKDIAGYGDGAGNYYLISSPIGSVAPADVANLIADDAENYDLYAWDGTTTEVDGSGELLVWRNFKVADNNFTTLEPGHGYLYANHDDVTLTFEGNAYNGTATFALDLGWNLMGNPFAVNATITGNFLVMNTNGTGFIVADRNYVEPMEGCFIEATAEGQNVTFTVEGGGVGGGGLEPEKSLVINLTGGRGTVDRAIVRFGGDNMMSKLQLNQNGTQLYIPMDGKDYAVVSAAEMGEMPVNFKAEKNGTYSLIFNAKNTSFNYLHLIDNMTGADVDLIANPSYSFDATTSDYASRFKLVFATGNSNDDSFACYYNGNIIVSNEGNATLNIVDVLGRTISSQNINGSENVNINAKAGVYMLQLIQGEKVMTQKIVVE